MKTQQKKNWMPYLIIGISLLTLISCDKNKAKLVDYIITVDHVYVNNCGGSLTMEVYNQYDEMFKSYNLEHGDSINILTTDEFVPALFYFDSFTDKIGDSVIVKFSNGKCLTYLDQITNNKIFNEEEYDNYHPELIKPGIPYTLYYTFTRKDYFEAVDCE